MRAIPGRRWVYDALWNGGDVIVKLFGHKINARRHLKREWRGLNLLQRRGLNSPAPLFFGKTEDGRWAVVVEKIADSPTVLDVFNKTKDITEKLDLLILVCKELAKQHSKGVLQKDLHLGNFLLRDDKVFAVDPGQMYFSSGEVGKKKSLSQIAILAHSLPEQKTKYIAMLCEQYLKARRWRFEKSDMALLQKQLTAHKKRAVRRGLKKSLRTSKRCLKVKADRYVAMFDKSFCQGAEPLDFIEQIDALMDAGEVLKNGNTCYVSHLTWNSKDIVVKRYNHKGFIHSLRHTIKRSRARRCWLHGHRLCMLNITTPKPLAYIEKHKRLLLWNCYLVTEYARGQKLYDFLRDDSVTKQQRSKATRQVAELLDELGKHRISHGDLKHSNILITENGPAIIDLDAMTAHKWGRLYNLRRAKDLERFAELFNVFTNEES